MDPIDETEQKQISAADRVAAFLADDAVKGAMARLSRTYYEEFKKAATPEAREAAWSKSAALDDLATQLQAVIDTGTRTKADVERRERLHGKRPAR